MKNVKSFVLGAALLLALISVSPQTSAYAPLSNQETAFSLFTEGEVAVIQGRVAADVTMTVEGAVQLTLIDADGKIVWDITIPANVRHYKIDKTELAAGDYLLIADTETAGKFSFIIDVD